MDYFVSKNIFKIKPKDMIKINDMRLGHPNNDAVVDTVERSGMFGKFVRRISGIIQGTFHDNTPFVYTVWKDKEPTLEIGV